jgi:heterodisulfide reductase subunit A2
MARIGVFICECGGNIADKVDVAKVVGEISGMADVVVAEPFRLLCSPDGKNYLERRIKEERLTHVVVAACSPRDHQQTFMKVCEKAGANPYLLQMVNIREQCAWVTEKPSDATRKAVRMVRAAVSRVRYHSPLKQRSIPVNPDVLVLGGGIGGIEASLRLSGLERKVYLVERTSRIGGVASTFSKSFPDMQDLSAVMKAKIGEVMGSERIEVLTECELEQALGFFGNFEVRLRSNQQGGGSKDIKVGAIILATGAGLFDPGKVRGYGYPSVPGVLTAAEFEEMNRKGTIALEGGRAPSSVAIIHCVGREVTGYCSEICCLYSLKFSRYLSQAIPDVKVTHLYSDICVPGKESQKFLEGTLGSNITLQRAADVKISKGEGCVAVRFIDPAGAERALSSDMVILAPAMVPDGATKELAERLGVSLDRDGFYAKQHDRLLPVSATREGVFVVGCAQGPKDIPSTIVLAKAASGAISATLVPGRKMEIESKTSQIVEAYCQGCGSCVSVCPFGAIKIDERRKVAVVNEVICRGCGNCSAACPSGAATVKQSTYDQIYQEIAEAVR